MEAKKVTDSKPINEEWLTIREAADFWNVDRSTLYKLIKDGKLEVSCVEKRYYIREGTVPTVDSRKSRKTYIPLAKVHKIEDKKLR